MSASDDDGLSGTLISKASGGAATPNVRSLPVESPGRYAFESQELGRGGGGRVLLLTDVALGRTVASKELSLDITEGDDTHAAELRARFLNEARITAQLEHPGVVPVYELGQKPSGEPYYTMKHVRGRSLEQAQKDCATLSERLALLPHYLDVVQTVAYAHSKGVIHRDLKPSNVMVGAFGETQVLDWGLARLRGAAEPIASSEAEPKALPSTASQTMHGQVMGTPTHMSPEQARGDVAHIDETSDVWALGVMLFELLCGQRPFSASDVAGVLAQVRDARAPDVLTIEPLAPKALAAVVRQALAAEPQARFRSAVEMAQAVEAALHARIRPPGARARSWLAMGASVLVAALAGLYVAALRREMAESAAHQTQQRDEERRHATLLAERSLDALQRKDFVAAERFAGQALAAAPQPLATGVQALALSTPHPQPAWSVRTEAGCAAVALGEDVIACATFGGVQLYRASTGDERGRLSAGPTGWQRAVAFLPDEPIALSAGDDKLVRVWETREQKLLAEWPGHQRPVMAMALTSSGARLATGSLDGEVRVWERATGQSRLLTTLPMAVRALAFSADGRLAASTQQQAYLWQSAAGQGSPTTLNRPASAFVIAGKQVGMAVERSVFIVEGNSERRLDGPLDDVRALSALADGTLIAGDARGTLWAWSVASVLHSRTEAFAPGVQALAAGADGLLAVATADKRLEVWQWQPSLDTPVGDPTAAAYDGRLLLGQRSGEVWRATAQGFANLPGRHGAPVRAIAAAAGRVLSGAEDGSVWWREPNVDEPRVLAAPSARRVTALAIAPDASLAAWAFDDGTFALYGLSMRAEVTSGKGTTVRSLAFDPPARLLAVGFDDKHLSLLDAQSGAEQATIEGLDGAVTALAFAPDGRTLAAAGERTTALLDAKAARVVRRLMGPLGRIGTLSFSPDGQLLSAGSDDGDAWVWEHATGEFTAHVPLAASDVMLVHFASPGALVTLGTDRSLRTVRLPNAGR